MVAKSSFAAALDISAIGTNNETKTNAENTSGNNILFYVKQGFDKYEKTIKNFFIDNYKEEIWDGDLQCIDMYYYSKSLE